MRITDRLLVVLGATFLAVGTGAAALYFVVEEGRERQRSEVVGGLVAAQVFDRIDVAMRSHRGAISPELLASLRVVRPVLRVTLLNGSGRVAASTEASLLGRSLARTDAGCRDCHGRPGRESVRLGETLRWARPLLPAGSCRECHAAATGALGCILVDISLAEYGAEVVRELGGGMALLAAIFGVIGWTTIALTRRWVLTRVDALAGIMERFQGGDFSPRAVIGGRDEIGLVEGGFNRMADALRAREEEQAALLERLSAANEELQVGEERVRHACDTQRVLNDVLRIAHGGQPLDAVLQRALDLVLGIEWLAVETRGSVFLAEGQELVMRAQTGLPPAILVGCARVPFGECVCGQAAATRRLVHRGTAGADEGSRHRGLAPHGHYCVPILSAARETLGVLNLYVRPGHLANVEETDFLTAVAATLGGVIERHRAHAERDRLIGELRKALALVSRSQGEWQATFDGITDLISILDGANRIVKVNLAFAAYFGRHPRDLVGRPCCEFCIAAHPGPGTCTLMAAAREGSSVAEDVVDPRSGRAFRLSVHPYASGDGPVDRFVHLAEDVTAAREGEQRLIMSERLAALGQMASGIAHEVNNPLASIAGCAESLLARIERGRLEPQLLREYLGIIHEEVFRCKKITTAMLSFVRGRGYEKRLVDLGAALDRALELVGFQGRLRGVEIARAYAEPPAEALASEDELRQVFLIVLTNALDAMQETGTLRCSVASEGGAAVVTIADSGPGIAPEHLPRVFAPYFTTKAERGGAGLGLSIARRIVEDAGGSISVSSVPGEGTTLTISLPAH